MSMNFELGDGGAGNMPPGAAFGISTRGLDEIVEALCALLDRERDALNAGRYEPLAKFAAEKHHLLAQFDRHVKAQPSDNNDPRQDERIARLRSALDANMQLLKFRIDAINELAATIEQATRLAESDGTYDGGPGGTGMGWA